MTFGAASRRDRLKVEGSRQEHTTNPRHRVLVLSRMLIRHASRALTLIFTSVAVSCIGTVEDTTAATDAGTSVMTTSSIGADSSSSSGDDETSNMSTSGSSAGSTGLGAVCGDGVVEFGEDCDDANDDPNDGCLGDCTRPQSLLWEHEYVGEGQSTVVDLGVDSAGNVIVLGIEQADDNSWARTWLQKLSPDGVVVWTELDDEGSKIGGALAVLPDGNFYWFGSRLVADEQVQGMRRYSGDGLVEWHKDFEDQTLLVTAAATLPDSEIPDLVATGFELTGPLDPVTPDADAWIARTSAEGDVQWKTTTAGVLGGTLRPLDLAPIGDGSVVVVGRDHLPSSSKFHPWMARYSLADGELMWRADYPEPEHFGSQRRGIASVSGDFVVTGSVVGGDSLRVWRHMIDGAPTYSRVHEYRRGYDIAVADGSLFVIGVNWADGLDHAFAQRWSATGELLWSLTFDDSGLEGGASVLAIAPGTSFVLGGWRDITPGYNRAWVAGVAR